MIVGAASRREAKCDVGAASRREAKCDVGAASRREAKCDVGAASRRDYVQDERYITKEHMDKVRALSAREGSLGCVRRDCVSFARG